MWYINDLEKLRTSGFPNRISRDTGTELLKTRESGAVPGEAGRLGPLNMLCDAGGPSLVIECLCVVQNLLGVAVSPNQAHLSAALTVSCTSHCGQICAPNFVFVFCLTLIWLQWSQTYEKIDPKLVWEAAYTEHKHIYYFRNNCLNKFSRWGEVVTAFVR